MNKKMKKNKAMRAAGGLFVATMLTTSVVSGTYAKYITADEANDNARVAVFGVKVEASGDLFAQTYLKGPDNTPGKKSNGNPRTAEENTISVKSQSTYTGTGDGLTEQVGENGASVNNVVAPGTQSSKEGLRLSLTGTPEVDVKVVFDFGDMSDIWLAKNDNNTYYPNMTNGKIYDGDFVYSEVSDADNNSDVFKVIDTYYPVEFTFAGNEDLKDIHTLGDFEEWVAGKLNDYAKGIGSTVNKEGDHRYTLIVPAGNDLGEIGLKGVNITWKWEFGNETGVSGNDWKDTLLGDLAHDTFGGDNGNPVQEGLVKEATDAIQAAIDKIPPEGGNYSEWVNKTYTLANLENMPGKPATDLTTDAYNLIANFNLSISVTQVD